MNYPDRLIITGRVKETSRFNKSGDKIYLYYSSEAGGWWQWSEHESWATRFSQDDKRLKDALASASQMGPWYYYPDPESIAVETRPAIVTVT